MNFNKDTRIDFRISREKKKEFKEAAKLLNLNCSKILMEKIESTIEEINKRKLERA